MATLLRDPTQEVYTEDTGPNRMLYPDLNPSIQAL